MKMRHSMTAAVLAVLAGSGEAQFSVATSSGQWAPATAPRSAGASYGYSDCTTENSLGLTNGGEIAWFQGFDTNDRGLALDVIVQVASANGWRGSTHCHGVSEGAMFVYDDPGGDHIDPTDLTGVDLRSSTSWTVLCPTDLKEPRAVCPAPVSDGFWLAAMLEQFAGEFPAPMDTDTAPSFSRSWVTGSNTKFDPHDPGAGIGFLEMAALGFDSHWVMSGSPGAGSCIRTYCTAKTGLVCGAPEIAGVGTPEAGATAGFIVRAEPARGARSGLVLYSCEGRAGLPFQGGFLCVAPSALRRTPAFDSGGSAGACDGVFAIDFNTFASGHGGGQPDACLATPGQRVNAQVWGRDSMASGSFLSNGLEFDMWGGTP